MKGVKRPDRTIDSTASCADNASCSQKQTTVVYMLNQEKTHHIDTFAHASVPHAKCESDDDLIYAQDSLVFQSVHLSAADVLTIRRENTGTSPVAFR